MADTKYCSDCYNFDLLVNQGIKWCGKGHDLKGVADDCEDFKPMPECITICTNQFKNINK